MYFLSSTFWLIGNVELSCIGLYMPVTEGTDLNVLLNQF